MSTLGRKAMKKTIDRLRKNALVEVDRYLEYCKRLLVNKESPPTKLMQVTIDYSLDVLIRLNNYISAVEDYRQELDDAWEKLLESAKQTKSIKKKDEGKQKKEKTKETRYIS